MKELYFNSPDRIKDLDEQEEYIKEVIATGIKLGHNPPLEAHHVGYYLYED